MSEDNSERGSFWARVFRRTWYRGGREADISNVSVGKLQNAAGRGVRIDITESKPGGVKAKIHKIVVEGDDEP